jgi:protein-disulfide isomerase
MMKSMKTVVAATLMLATVALLQTQSPAEAASSDPLSEAVILRDPDIPVLGNAKGDITVIEYFDYQCPYCKKFNPDLMKIVREDGHIRLVFKDWPIFGNISVEAAKLVLATKYQNKYAEAHEALISVTEKLSEDNLQNALVQAGVDVERAKRDLASNRKTIDAILARNQEQAQALGFQGTPSFIVGHFRVPGVLDPASFKRAITEARAAAKKK